MLNKCLNFEIKSKQRKFNKLNRDYKNGLDLFKGKVSWLDYKVLVSKLTHCNHSKIKNVKSIHKDKLERLGISDTNLLDADKVIFNYSCRILSKEEKDVLKLGLQFGFSGKKPRFIEHYLSYEKFSKQILDVKKDYGQVEEVISKIKGLAHEGYNLKENDKGKVNINILDSLRKDKSILVTKPDKGRGVVILNKEEYIRKTEEILNDKTKFKLLNGDCFKIILKLEDRLNRLLRAIKSKLPDGHFNFLFASGSLPGILYGLPKIHKEGCPIRPILSAIGTFNYNIAKLLVPILSPLAQNKYTVKNSIDFARQLKTYEGLDSYYLASFDVKSLFTNIPLQETIDICVNESEKKKIIPFNLTKKQFKSLLELAVKESVFMFNDKLYQQTDGVAMGSPLGPTLANTFLGFHEENWLSDCPKEFKPIQYNRYVDDCFLIFKCKTHADLFLNYLNSKHKNITFTVEHEVNNQLPFLDILISKNSGKLTTEVFRKDTYTGLGLNYSSFVPSLYKINSIKTLIHRAYNLCSSWENFHQEIERLETYFCANGYPKSLFMKYVKRFVANKFSSTKSEEEIKEIRYIKLPFQGHFSYQVRNTMLSVLKQYIPDINFRFVFVNNNTIGSLFRVKDPMPTPLCSNIVYSYKCPDCMSRYIGSTSRNLRIRISEHRGNSYRTGQQITSPSFSKIREHSLEYNHAIRDNEFKIMFKARTLSDLRIAESLAIIKVKPDLNCNELATKLHMLS